MAESSISAIVKDIGVCASILVLGGACLTCSVYQLADYVSPEQAVKLQQEQNIQADGKTEKSLEVAVESEGKSVATRAFELRMGQKIEEAIRLLEEAVKADPDDSQAKFELARMYFYTAMPPWFGGIAKAQEMIKEAVEAEPTNERYHYWAGCIAVYRGINCVNHLRFFRLVIEFKKAAKAFECAVALKPDYHEARLSLIQNTVPWFLGGNIRNARKHAEKLQELDPVLGAVAMCKIIHCSEVEQKMDIWREVLKERSQDARVHQGIGQVYLSAADPMGIEERRAYLEKAIEHMNKAHELNPDSVEILLKIAWCHHFGEDYEAAVEAYEKLLNLEPAPPVHMQKKVMRRLCGINRHLGNNEKADELCKKAEELSPYWCLVDEFEDLLRAP